MILTTLFAVTNTFTSFSMKELTDIDPDAEYRMYANFPIVAIVAVMWYSIFNDVHHAVGNMFLTQEITSCSNAIVSVLLYTILGLESAYQWIMILSCGFFINDIIVNWNISRRRGKNPLLNPFIYHHLISIYALSFSYIGPHREMILTVYHYLELSNILMYVTFICESMIPEYKNLIMILYHYQFLTFIPIRVLWYPYHLLVVNYTAFLGLGVVCNISALFIYMVGLGWSRELYRRCVASLFTRSIQLQPT